MKRLGLFVLGTLPWMFLSCSNSVEEAAAIYGPDGPPSNLSAENESTPFGNPPLRLALESGQTPHAPPRQIPPKAPVKPIVMDGSKPLRIAEKTTLATAQRIGVKKTIPNLKFDVSKIAKPADAKPAPSAEKTATAVPPTKPPVTTVTEKPAAEKPVAEKPAAETPKPDAPAPEVPAKAKPAQEEEVSPKGSVTSDSTEETKEVGPWVGTGSTRLSVVKEGDFPLPPAAGKYSLKASAGKSATAVVKSKKDGLSLETKAQYVISFKVFSRIDPYTCVINLVDDKKKATPAADKASKAEKWELAPDKWNTVEAVVQAPEGPDSLQALQFEFSGVPKSSWYVDDVRIVKVNP